MRWFKETPHVTVKLVRFAFLRVFTNVESERNFEDFGMAEPMILHAVFAPTVSMIATDKS